jgi:flavin reductase (DIM6/NTAB) family NADH-FMN oxidoreductase RutF
MEGEIKMNFDGREFRNALGSFPTGVTVITVEDEKNEYGVRGLTANAISSVSLDPPIVLICVDHKSTTLPVIKEKGHYSINFLKQEQVGYSKFFAKQKLDEALDITFKKSEEGIPYIEDALTNLNCEVIETVEMGDHTVFFGEVKSLNVNEGEPLLFFKGKYSELAPQLVK